MGLQGNKATHDFLSLYTAASKDSPLPLPQLPGSNSKPPPSPPAQGFFLRTHDFLQPLEKPSSQSPPPPSHPANNKELSGGVGTFTISHAAPVVKQEPPFALWGAAAAADPRGTQRPCRPREAMATTNPRSIEARDRPTASALCYDFQRSYGIFPVRRERGAWRAVDGNTWATWTRKAARPFPA